MPQQPFIMRLHFYLPTGTGLHSLASGAHHVAYAGSKEKAELMIEKLLDESNRHTSLESAAIHARYAGERSGSLGYFGSMAADPKAAQKSILAAQGPVWRVINTVGEQDAINMGGDLITKDGWAKASQPVVAKMIKELGLDPAKVQWIAAAHRHQKHEHNPHIHLLIWEQGEPTRKTGEWTDEERRNIRKAWISELYRPERQQLGKEKSTARTQARTQLMDLVGHRNEKQGFNRELTARLATLGKMLPGQGRLAYAFMPVNVKAETETIIRWLWSTDPGLRAQHDRYLDTAEKMGTFYWHRDPDKTQNTPGRQEALDRIKANAESDLIQRLAAPVLKAARDEAMQASGRNTQRTNALVGALHRMMWRAEHDARATAYWLAESQWQRKKAESAIAQSTGQEIAQ